MKLRYEWRELQNGLLVEPRECGPYYNKDGINGEEMDTKEKAIERYKKFKKQYEFEVAYELVLIEIYCIAD